MDYQAIEDLLFDTKESELIMDGSAYTLPFFARYNGRFGDVFFLYYLSDDGTAMVYGFIMVDPNSRVTLVSKIGDELIGQFELPNKISNENASKFKELYARVHQFAFNDDLTSEQINTLKEFTDLQKKCMTDSQIFFYFNVFPEFFVWTQRFLR